MRKRCMMFVDGENFTIRMQDYAKKEGKTLPGPHVPNAFWWGQGIHSAVLKLAIFRALEFPAFRSYWYTCLIGDEKNIASTHDMIQQEGFNPVVLKKAKSIRAKGVDISLTKDMLVHAFFQHYEAAVLVAGDGDYVPLVDEVKRLGRQVVIFFLDEKNGLNPKLRRAADSYVDVSTVGDEPLI